jgi:hypothetical protein
MDTQGIPEERVDTGMLSPTPVYPVKFILTYRWNPPRWSAGAYTSVRSALWRW